MLPCGEQRTDQLSRGGKNQFTIECLLHDSRQWDLLRSSLKDHLSKSKEALSNFTSHEVLYMELMDANRIEVPENLPVIIKLAKKIELIEKECGDAIARLEQETKELIGLVGVRPYGHMNCMAADTYGRNLTWFPFLRLVNHSKWLVGPSKCPSQRTAWR